MKKIVYLIGVSFIGAMCVRCILEKLANDMFPEEEVMVEHLKNALHKSVKEISPNIEAEISSMFAN